MSDVQVVDVNKGNLYDFTHCFVQNRKHPGYIAKTDWLKNRLVEGLRYKLLTTGDGKWAGFIEYAPAAKSWRAVKAEGYMVVHCIWTYPKNVQHRGYGRMLIDECVKDAQRSSMHGVVVLTRTSSKGTFIARNYLFIKAGFTLADTSPPDYELLVKKFRRDAPDPEFPRDLAERTEKYSKGLTILWSSQCPYGAKAVEEMIETANQRGIKFRAIELKSAREAQAAPTPYAVFSILYNGEVVADHMVSNTRFKNILRQIGL